MNIERKLKTKAFNDSLNGYNKKTKPKARSKIALRAVKARATPTVLAELKYFTIINRMS